MTPITLHNILKLNKYSSIIVKSIKTYTCGIAPPKGINVEVLRYHGWGGISLESLFTLTGCFICPFLNPKNEPTNEFDKYKKKNTLKYLRIVVKAIAEELYSNQYAVFMMNKLIKIKSGMSIDYNTAFMIQSVPFIIL